MVSLLINGGRNELCLFLMSVPMLSGWSLHLQSTSISSSLHILFKVCLAQWHLIVWVSGRNVNLFCTSKEIIPNCRWSNFYCYCIKSLSGVYIAEISDSSSRRLLSPLHTIGQCFGFLLGCILSAFLTWRTSKLILGSTFTLPSALIVLLLHETPYWLVKKGLLDEAR